MGLRVLIVEDDRTIAELIDYNLKKEGFEARTVYDGALALDAFESWRPDVILLDVMLPEINGFDVCRAIRTRSMVPIIMLTAKSEEVDRVLGLELGADDYITKPFSPRELIARIRAVMRRVDAVAEPRTERRGEDRILRLGRLSIDTERHTATLEGAPVDLTPREFDLLYTLAANAGKVFTREYLMDSLWGYEYMGDTRTVDVHIRRLRKKLASSEDEPHAILTVHGLGYKMRGNTR